MKVVSEVFAKIRKIFNRLETRHDIPGKGLTFAIRNPKTGRKEIRVADGLHSALSCPKMDIEGNTGSPTTLDQL